MRALMTSLVASLTLLGIACGDKDDGYGDTGGYYGGGGGGWDTGDAGFDAGDDDDGYEPEEEESFVALEPAGLPEHVFVANATRGTVTRISTGDLSVITTEVGVNPLTVQPTPDGSRAVTLNSGTDDLSIIDADTLDVVDVAVRDGFNTLSISPDGRWALAYHDVDQDDADTEDSGAQSFTELSLVDLETLEHYPRVVGFKPHDLQFTDDGSLALVVSDAYLALVDLSGTEPDVTRIEISDDAVDPPAAEEVLLAPDGSYAFVRQFGLDGLLVVDLSTGLVDQVEVGELPTDLDVTPEGTQAIAVSRAASELWLYDLADPFAQAGVVPLPEGYTFGSLVLSPDGQRGLLYSTAADEAVYAIWDRTDDSVTVYGLVKSVESMSVSPDGKVGLAFHSNAPGPDSESPFFKSHAVTLIDLDDAFANPLLLGGEPITWADSDDGAWGFLVMEGVESVVAVNYGQLLDHEVALKSPPEWAGVIPGAHLAYVSQEHELGRISFFDPDAMTVSTVTGFELNAEIEVHDAD